MSYGVPTRFGTGSRNGRSRRCVGSKSLRICRRNMVLLRSVAPTVRFGGNAARMYRINLKAADNIRMPTFSEDRLAALKSEYELAAKEPSNLRYGYVRAA